MLLIEGKFVHGAPKSPWCFQMLLIVQDAAFCLQLEASCLQLNFFAYNCAWDPFCLQLELFSFLQLDLFCLHLELFYLKIRAILPTIEAFFFACNRRESTSNRRLSRLLAKKLNRTQKKLQLYVGNASH